MNECISKQSKSTNAELETAGGVGLILRNYYKGGFLAGDVNKFNGAFTAEVIEALAL